MNATFGLAAVEVYISSNGDMRFQSLNVDSSTASVVVSSGLSSTTSDLFDPLNLGVAGFVGFGTPVFGAEFGYLETIPGSPLVLAPVGTVTDQITFTTGLLPTDVIEVTVL